LTGRGAIAEDFKVTSRAGGERLLSAAKSIAKILIGSDELSIQAQCYRLMARWQRAGGKSATGAIHEIRR
jgi:hypothetical protein